MDYFTEEESIFAIFYQRLKDKGVTFPDPNDHTFMTNEENKKFNANYKNWKTNMDKLSEISE